MSIWTQSRFGGAGGLADVSNLDADNILSGTLASARLPTVPVSKGGTGATTASQARTNLGIVQSMGGQSIQSDWTEADTSSVAFILNKPTIFSGSYDDLTDKPTIFSGSYDDLTNKPTLFTVHGTPTDDQVVKWDAGNSRWEAADDEAGSGGGGAGTPLSVREITGSSGDYTVNPNEIIFYIVAVEDSERYVYPLLRAELTTSDQTFMLDTYNPSGGASDTRVIEVVASLSGSTLSVAISALSTSGASLDKVYGLSGGGTKGDTGATGASAWIQYSTDGSSWHNALASDDEYIRFATGATRPANSSNDWSDGRQFVGSGGGSGEDNVQADWSITDLTSDAYIKNKPALGTAAALSSGTAEGRIAVLASGGVFALARIPHLPASQLTTGVLAVERIPDLAASKITSGQFAATLIPSLAASIITSGEFDDDRIPDLSASKITSGTLNSNRIPGLSASKITSGTLSTSRIPGLSAAFIIGGTFNADRIPTLTTSHIPNLNASKITSGVFSTSRIPDLSADKITSDSFATARIPNLSATKITSGVFALDRIPTLTTNKLPTVPIEKGGTGATSLANAQDALGIHAIEHDDAAVHIISSHAVAFSV